MNSANYRCYAFNVRKCKSVHDISSHKKGITSSKNESRNKKNLGYNNSFLVRPQNGRKGRFPILTSMKISFLNRAYYTTRYIVVVVVVIFIIINVDFLKFALIRFFRGNIPGSINIAFNQAFSPEGDLLPCSAVSALYGHKGRIVVCVGNKTSKNAVNVSCIEFTDNDWRFQTFYTPGGTQYKRLYTGTCCKHGCQNYPPGISMTPYKMQNLVYEWVIFLNFPNLNQNWLKF